MKHSTAIIANFLLFATAALCVWLGGRWPALALPAILAAIVWPLLGHCQCFRTIERLVSARHPDKWREIKGTLDTRFFVFAADDLGDPEIAARKAEFRRWNRIFGCTLVASLIFVALCSARG